MHMFDPKQLDRTVRRTETKHCTSKLKHLTEVSS